VTLTTKSESNTVGQGNNMATASLKPLDQKQLDGAVVSLDDSEIRSLIDHEAKVAGLSGIDEAITRVQQGKVERGFIWDNLSMLISLL
jgi:hypothetical protein